MMRMMGKVPGALALMKPMFPILFPRLLPMMMPKVMPTMLSRVAERIPMPDYMLEQMPALMPKVMDNLMPHMIGDVERSTSWGSGIEEQSLGFVVFTMGIWFSRWENALSRLLPPGQYDHIPTRRNIRDYLIHTGPDAPFSPVPLHSVPNCLAGYHAYVGMWFS